MFSRRWRWTSLLVLAASGIMVRLGIWQLDRLEQRQDFNTHVVSQQAAGLLDLSLVVDTDSLGGMEYRAVAASGSYDPGYQVAIRNQVWNGEYGYYLLTPLVMDDGRVVMVNRGWIPASYDTPESWQDFDQPGKVPVSGIIRLGQEGPDMGGVPDPELAPGQERLDFWNFINIDRLQQQVPYPLLPIYIQVAPEEVWTDLPYRSLPDLDLTEGNHLGYALQWFSYAAILFFGYPFYLKRSQPAGGSKQMDQGSG